MSYNYDKYLVQHMDGVAKAYMWICNHIPSLIKAPIPESQLRAQICSMHDRSKESPEEYGPYDDYFYGHDKSDDVKKNFNIAWLHHIHHNPHHWQHWVLINDNPNEGEIILDMPYHYILEMICDWWAFSWKSGNLGEIFSWYDAHKDYMKLSDKTRKTVEDILSSIKDELEADDD